MSALQAVVYVNGTISLAETAVVPVFDHGFLYGEGVYETLRTYRRVPFLFGPHMARLRRSAALLALDVPFSDADLAGWVDDTMAAHERMLGSLPEAYIRILLTRGVGALTYNPAACPVPTLIIIVKVFPAPPAETFTKGIAVALVDIRRNHPHALNPTIKSNNLLNNALAMQEALRHGADEALMLNGDGHVVECSQSNFFIVTGGRLRTAPLADGLLPGITRQFVMDLGSALGVATDESSFGPEDVFGADEAFITGTTREVTPVVRVGDRIVGTGTPGPLTRRLLEAFQERAVSGTVDV
jgi:branched-chain amino acid aminotransferase